MLKTASADMMVSLMSCLPQMTTAVLGYRKRTWSSQQVIDWTAVKLVPFATLQLVLLSHLIDYLIKRSNWLIEQLIFSSRTSPPTCWRSRPCQTTSCLRTRTACAQDAVLQRMVWWDCWSRLLSSSALWDINVLFLDYIKHALKLFSDKFG